MNLNGMNMFIEYNWLVKYNLEVNWNMVTIWFTKYPKKYKTRYQDITFISRIWKSQSIDNKDKEQQKIRKEPDPTNPEDLPEYI